MSKSKILLDKTQDFMNEQTEFYDDYLERKKIVIKHRKIKKATRTFIYNIDQWISSTDLANLSKKIKKGLATSSQIITDEEGVALTFNGDHTLIIKNLLIDYSDGKITAESFEL